MKTIATVLAVTVLCGTPVMAQDHLVPESSVIGGSEFSPDYQSVVQAVLHEAYADDVKVRLIVEPSFSPEAAIGLKEDNGNYRIFTLAPAVQLWGYESLRMMKGGEERLVSNGNSKDSQPPDNDIAALKAYLPADVHDVKVKRCEADIDPALGARIVEVWKAMLLDTRYARGPEYVKGPDGKMQQVVAEVMDGTLFHFSMFGGLDFLAGQAHSPFEGTKPAQLVNIADMMDQFCQTKDPKFTAQMNRDVDALLAQLKTPAASGTKP
jgi:hypothetical protein